MVRHFELTEPPEGLAAELGPGGDRVERLLRGICAADRPERAPDSPLTAPGSPLTVVRDPAVAAAAMDRVDPAWLEALDRRRGEARERLVAAGREKQLDTAEHVAMLVATPRLDPADQTDPDARAVSGALLWLIGTVVADALADPGGAPAANGDGPGPGHDHDHDHDDPLSGLADLLASGWWPIGPVNGDFLISPYAADGGEPHAR
ncbi:hypothetical protein AB0G15_33135 [Streptosporangium sp. NPDC023825]|uniref:hypothetical protein n=1 Tax=Streptosporangium sp. NPDC023825 TaxID=3154909 RepID=UPI003446A194